MGKESLARKIIEAARPEPDEPKVKRGERPIVLMVNRRKRSREDRMAVRALEESQLRFIIVERNGNDIDEEVLPRIWVDGGMFRGLPGIVAYLRVRKL